MYSDLKEKLQTIITQGTVSEQEPMSKHTSFSIGGPADFFVEPATVQEIKEVCYLAKEENIPCFILGNGSNLLVSDHGIRGIVLHLGRNFSSISREDKVITVQAGAMLSRVARTALDASLTGFEFAAGIPGSFGGAVAMNAGAYGGEMKDIILDADVLTPDGQVKTLTLEELDLSYRHSCIFEKNYIVLSARIELNEGDPIEIKARMDELAGARREKQPLEYPSAGSTFKRPVGYFAGKLIQDAGLKGFAVGGAMVSEKHAGFVVNYNKASAKDVRDLIAQVQEKIQAQFGVKMEPEVRFVGFDQEV